MFLGKRLKSLRRKKYSQEEFAELLQVSHNTISRWENDIQEPRVKMISEMAKVLGTSSAYLMGETDNPSEPEIKNPSTQNEGVKVEESEGTNNMLVFRNGTQEVKLPDTDKNRELFLRIIEKMSIKPAGAMA